MQQPSIESFPNQSGEQQPAIRGLKRKPVIGTAFQLLRHNPDAGSFFIPPELNPIGVFPLRLPWFLEIDGKLNAVNRRRDKKQQQPTQLFQDHVLFPSDLNIRFFHDAETTAVLMRNSNIIQHSLQNVTTIPGIIDLYTEAESGAFLYRNFNTE